MSVTVYALRSTRDYEIRYVGQTVQTIERRLRQHRCDSKRNATTPVRKWFAREVGNGYEIQISVLVADAILHTTEIDQIAKHRASGFRLLNLTSGGEGTVGWRGNAGNKRPDLSDRNRAARGKPGHAITAETKAKISAANSGVKKPWLAERNRQAAGQPGHKHSDASRAKIAEAHKGRLVSAETRRKISDAAKGRKLSPGQIAALRAGYRRHFEEKRA